MRCEVRLRVFVLECQGEDGRLSWVRMAQRYRVITVLFTSGRVDCLSMFLEYSILPHDGTESNPSMLLSRRCRSWAVGLRDPATYFGLGYERSF